MLEGHLERLDELIAEAQSSGGSKRTNYQLFIVGLCDVLGQPRPVMARAENEHNDYGFERRTPAALAARSAISCRG